MTKPRILVIDSYYPDAIKAMPFNPSVDYEQNLQAILAQSFGTFDAYSRNLRALGWDAVDVIANHEFLQRQWIHRKHKYDDWSEFAAQVDYYLPDILFLQDLNIKVPVTFGGTVASQCSCPWPGDEKIRKCDVVFTSFPHYVPRIEALGVRAVYNPLAFEPDVFKRCNPDLWLDVSRASEWQERIVIRDPYHERERIHDCVFIGGVGNPSHWKYGMEVLETVAREIPTFKWWGYGQHLIVGKDSLLLKAYQGEAWGLDMYEILLRSKIVLNRHGEVAQGFANNMRMYEANGCGAMLLTDNETDLFAEDEIVRYSSPADAVIKIRYYLEHEDERAAIAARGQARTLRDHTYQKRMKVVSETLKEMLVAA